MDVCPSFLGERGSAEDGVPPAEAVDPVQCQPSVQVFQRRFEGLRPHVGCFHRRREAEGAGSGYGRRAGGQGGHVRSARAEGQRAGPRRCAGAGGALGCYSQLWDQLRIEHREWGAAEGMGWGGVEKGSTGETSW